MLHGKTMDEKKQKAMIRVQQLYTQWAAVLAQECFLFDKSLESWESHSGMSLKAIQKSMDMGLNHIIATHRSLDGFVTHTAYPLRVTQARRC